MMLPYSIRRKLKKSSANVGEWGGYLTPVEIMQLLQLDNVTVFGGKDRKKAAIEGFQDKIDKGISNPWWFYFYPDAELKSELER